jgi:hypothetical protein
MEEIKALANSCHVVMSAIDGELIYRSLTENDGIPTPALLEIIDATLQFWTDHSSRKLEGRQNNYFVITKWDMFDESDASLRQIREMLLSIPAIAGYIRRLDKNSIVRFIPVSAVGRGFAKLNPTTRRMDIIAKSPSWPINVDVPIACLLPDLINAELAHSMEQLNEQAWRESQKKDSWWDRLAHFAGRLIESPGLTKLIGDLGIHYQCCPN